MENIGSNASKLDLAQRVSYLSNLSQKDDDYQDAKTPARLEDGALREGGAPNLFSKDYIGLIAQYAAVGLVYGALPQTLYPFLQVYLNSSGATYTTASTLVSLPWSFKVFYGVLSDCVPICGYRRRPYMLLGWTICFIMLLAMACMTVGKPYYPNAAARKADTSSSTYAELEKTFNTSASGQGSKYVMLMMLAAFGYLMSDVAADGVVAELAQREPLAVRGTTQTTIYGTRTVLLAIGQLLVGIFMNGEEYGGDFDFSLSFPQMMIILAVCTAPVLPITWFFIKEEKTPRNDFGAYLKELWRVVQTRAVYQIIFYMFFSGIFANFSYTVITPVQEYWAHVEPISNTMSSLLGSLVFYLGIYVTGRWGLHWNWRIMTVITGIAVIAVDLTVTMLVIWDVVRNQWFWLGPPIAVQVPAGISFLISTFITVELCGVGNEGAMYGLLTTVANLSSPFSTTLYRIIDNQWNMTNERIKEDDHSIRMDVSKAVILMYAMSVVSWFFLILLPRQKADAQELIRSGGSSKIIGGLTVFYLAFALVWSVMTNIMGIFNSTSCLLIAGGNGC